MTENIRDRREAERYKLRLPVTIQGEDNQVDAFTDDLSARGILLETDTELEGDSVTFIITFPPEITLSTSLHVRCEARVVRVLERSESHTRAAVRIHRYEFLSRNEQPKTAQNSARTNLREAS